MGMALTADQLVQLAGNVRDLEGVGVDVNEISAMGHRIFLRKEGAELIVVGISRIEDKQKAGGGNLRAQLDGGIKGLTTRGSSL